MRKPRQTWAVQEQKEIDSKAQANLEMFANMGDYVSFETCYMLAEIGYIQKKLDEIKRWMFDDLSISPR